MRHYLLPLLGIVCVAAVSLAGDDADRTRKVRAALSLAQAEVVVGCGTCSNDLPAAFAESAKLGKPVAVFVGGCDGKGTFAYRAGAVAVRTPKYDQADTRFAPSQPRIVVGYPRGGKFWVADTLPPTATGEQITAAVAAAKAATLATIGPVLAPGVTVCGPTGCYVVR